MKKRSIEFQKPCDRKILEGEREKEGEKEGDRQTVKRIKGCIKSVGNKSASDQNPEAREQMFKNLQGNYF